jgi:hypothetical protein
MGSGLGGRQCQICLECENKDLYYRQKAGTVNRRKVRAHKQAVSEAAPKSQSALNSHISASLLPVTSLNNAIYNS